MKIITLDNEKDLRIYTLPLRQKIVREMSRIGKPVTAKQIADRLKITPSAAQHHMKKLMSIGLIEADHHEMINGIKANFMGLTDVTVSIGQIFNDELTPSRNTFVRNHLLEIYNGFMKVLEINRDKPKLKVSKLNDIGTAIMHLNDEEADELHLIIEDYMTHHTKADKNTHPWEIAVVAYRMDLIEAPDKNNYDESI